MSLFITSLNSGSNGNCYYVGNDNEAVLIDVGISCREVEKRMKRLGLSIQKVKAIFVSHEHSDHISGIPMLANKHQLPVYVTPSTLRYCGFTLTQSQVRFFTAHMPVAIGDLTVTAFPKLHDAADPYSFTIACGATKVGVFTDIGLPCTNVIQHFSECHAAILEANYDEDMLEQGHYPFHLKKRIRGGKGHLSNNQALALFQKHRPSFMSHLLLAHLSKNNNCPKLVEQLFNQHANGAKIVVASRFEETAVYHICAANNQVADIPQYPAAQLQFSFA